MNSLLLCAILSASASLAFRVSFHTVDLKIYKYEHEPVLVCTQHKFIYHRGDGFTMYLQLPNNSTKAVAFVKNESGVTYLTRPFWPEGHPINFHPKFDEIIIEVELYVNNTCVRERILEGRVVSTTGTNVTAFKYNDICIKGNHCLVLVNPAIECKDQKLTPLPCEYGRYVEVVAPANEQRPTTANETNNNHVTLRAQDDSKGAENTYFVIMIVTSIIAAIALILLLLIAIKQRWCVNIPPGITQISPTNENPFYENVLFRKECQQEIEELEQREYDVVAGDNEYVEIYNRSGTVAASTPPHVNYASH